MTYQEQYEALPVEIKLLVESYVLNGSWADECLESMLSLCPQKECSVRALAEAYAEWNHYYLTAKAELEKHGIDAKMAMRLGAGYMDKHNKNK